jgi:two-component system phosphate regulon sensor histidine kinase PhoR
MVTRLLAYDPDPAARALIRRTARGEKPSHTLSVHATPRTCRRDLAEGRCDVLVLGLPMPSATLASLIQAAQAAHPSPAVVFLSEQPAEGEDWLPKTVDGLQQLVDVAGATQRAQGILRLACALEAHAAGDWMADTASLARRVVSGLDVLSVPAAFVRQDGDSGRWQIEATTLPRAATEALAEGLSSRVRSGDPQLTAPGGRGDRPRYAPIDLTAVGEPAPGRRGTPLAGQAAGHPLTILSLSSRDRLCAFLVVGRDVGALEAPALDRLGSVVSDIVHPSELRKVGRRLDAGREEAPLRRPTAGMTRNREAALNEALSRLRGLLTFDGACVLLAEGEHLRFAAVYAEEGKTRPVKSRSQGVLADGVLFHRVLRSGRAEWITDTRADPDWPADKPWRHVRSWVGVPLPPGDHAPGLLSLECGTVGGFHSVQPEAAAAAAGQVGLALEHASLLDRVDEEVRRTRRLLKLAGDVNRETDLTPLLDELVRQGVVELGVQRGLMLLGQGEADQADGACPASAGPGIRPDEAQDLCQAAWRIGVRLIGDSRRPVVLTPDSEASAHLHAFGVVSALLVPVRHEGSLLGFLLLDEPGQATAFDETDMDLAMAIADHAAVAIHHAATVANLRRQSEELTSLYDLGIQLSHELTVEGVVDLVFAQIHALVDLDAAVIARIGPEGLLHCDVLDVGRRLPALSVPLGGPTLSGHVIRSGEPLWIRDYAAEVDSLPVPGLTAGEEIASWLGVPLVARGQTIGAVSVQSKRPYQFTFEHLRLLRMIANHTAISLDNALLLQATVHQADQLRLVNEIGRYAVSVLDTQNLVREVTLRILQAFRLYAVQILLLEGGILVPQAVVRGPEGEFVRIGRVLSLRERSIMAEVARTGRPLLVPDVSKDPRFLPALELPETSAELAVPLMVGNDVVGVLDVQSERRGGLTEEDLELLQALSAQVAISVVNARLFAEVRAHTAQLEARVTARTAEIRSQKERTEAILRSVADAVVVLDLEGRLVLANPVAQELLRGPQGAEARAQIMRMHAEGGVVTETLDLAQMTFQALASPVTLGELAVGTVVVLRDITRLRELDRLKSHFVATVSHELRTPLANIRVYLSLLRKGHQERRKQYLQVLDQETGRLSEMIEELLDLSRLEDQPVGETPEPVALAPVLSLVLESHRPSAQAKGIVLALEAEPRAAVLGHRSQLIRVFANLVSNAIQYTPPGGHVRLRLEGPQDRDGVTMAQVSVEDDGQGIPQEDLPYIFDRFYRGSLARSNNVPGSGLGLAIVREIVDRHGGHVTVTSRLGEGSIFRIFLPLAEE